MKKIISVVFIALFANQVFAQQSVQFLNISSDPSYYSLGGATLTSDANAFSVSSNASAMALGEQVMSVAVGYGTWQPKAMNDGIASISGYGLIADRFAIGVNSKYMLHQSYDIIGKDGSIKEKFSPQDISMELGMAYKIIDGLSLGVNLRYISSTIYEETTGAAVAADVSLSFRLGALRVAAAATNLGSKIDYGYTPYNLPAMAKVGVGYSYDISRKSVVSVHAEGDYLIYHNGFMAGVGAEYNYNDMLRARVGYHYGDKNSMPSYASAGIGIKLVGITLDAAYILGFNNSVINGSYMITLGYSF